MIGALIRWARGTPWLLVGVLAGCFGLALISALLREAIAPDVLAGVRADLHWMSVSNGEVDATVGLRYFSREQVEMLAHRFPGHALIAASVATRQEVQSGSDRLTASVQFVHPRAFELAGVRLEGATPGAGQWCLAAADWTRRHAQGARTLTLGGHDVALTGHADARLRMFAGFEPVDLWCTWDLVGGTLAPALQPAALAVQPMYWLFVGARNANGVAQWREQTSSIELPRVLAMGLAVHRLTTIDGWVTHPELQTAMLQRVKRLEALASLLVVLGFALSLFIAVQRTLARRRELEVRLALGASPAMLLAALPGRYLAIICIAAMSGLGLAAVLLRVIWLDPGLAEMRLSGATLADVHKGASIAALVGLAVFSALWEGLAILRLSKSSQIRDGRHAGLQGLSGLRSPGTALALVALLSCWVVWSHADDTLAPSPRRFNLQDDLVVFQPRFAPGVWAFDRGLPRSELEVLAREVGANDGTLAVIENYPGLSAASLPGRLITTAGEECGDAGEMLRGSTQLLPLLVSAMQVGVPPATADEIAMSSSRARKCFGSIEHAYGAELRYQGRRHRVVGVYPDFDWHLGRGSGSAFVGLLSDSPYSYYAVAQATTGTEALRLTLLRKLQSLLPRITDLIATPLPEVAADLYMTETAQARVLAGLGLLLALGSIAACAALYDAAFRQRAPTLALHLALGASPASLAAQVLRPVALSTSIAAVVGAIALMPLVRHSPVLSELLVTTPTRMIGAIGSVVLLLVTVALLRLARVLGNRRLASELQAQ